jgi:hypothetical protein
MARGTRRSWISAVVGLAAAGCYRTVEIQPSMLERLQVDAPALPGERPGARSVPLTSTEGEAIRWKRGGEVKVLARQLGLLTLHEPTRFRIAGDELRWQTEAATEKTLAIGAIERVEVRVFSPWRTALVLGVATALCAGVAAIFASGAFLLFGGVGYIPN